MALKRASTKLYHDSQQPSIRKTVEIIFDKGVYQAATHTEFVEYNLRIHLHKAKYVDSV